MFVINADLGFGSLSGFTLDKIKLQLQLFCVQIENPMAFKKPGSLRPLLCCSFLLELGDEIKQRVFHELVNLDNAKEEQLYEKRKFKKRFTCSHCFLFDGLKNVIR